mgnify:CR=1 FL=1
MINKEFFEDWIEGSRGLFTNPAEWDGKNPECDIDCCEKEVEQDDDYCEDHQRCIVCGENDDCDCEDELSMRTSCCDSLFWNETDICSECKEHADSAWADEVEMSIKGR